MGVFEEDSAIRVSWLVKQWIGEGFVKPISGKNLEVGALENLKDLLDRNLVSIDELGCSGNIKYCKIHDLLRDLCLREGEKEGFYSVLRQHSPQALTTQRRIVIPRSISSVEEILLDDSHYMSSVRSLISENDAELRPSLDSRLLRVLHARSGGSFRIEDMYCFVNSRYIAFMTMYKFPERISISFDSTMYLLWNLRTLIVDHSGEAYGLVEIWKMPQLRHVEFPGGGLHLPDPPKRGAGDYIVLESLQTLSTIMDFKCDEEMIERIPNIKKLGISYERIQSPDCYCFNNLECLNTLESLSVRSNGLKGYEQELTFPQSLKKLSLSVSSCLLGDIFLSTIGSLPRLEGGEWKTTEGQFRSLKYLKLENCEVEYWTTESSHFPRLEHLFLDELQELEEVPLEIGEIPTLKSMDLRLCSESMVRSSKKMVEELEELVGEEVPLVVRVIVWSKEEAEALQSLAAPYFEIKSWESIWQIS